MNLSNIYRLACVGLIGLISWPLLAQQPHGDGFTTACNVCHSPDGWNVNETALSFDHDSATAFALDGGHDGLSCVDCHAEVSFINTLLNSLWQ